MAEPGRNTVDGRTRSGGAAACLGSLVSCLVATPALADPGLGSLAVLQYALLAWLVLCGLLLLALAPRLLRAARGALLAGGAADRRELARWLAIVSLVSASPWFLTTLAAPRLGWWTFGGGALYLVVAAWLARSLELAPPRVVRIAVVAIAAAVVLRTPEIISYTHYDLIDNVPTGLEDRLDLPEQYDSEYLRLRDGRLFALKRTRGSVPGPLPGPGTRLAMDEVEGASGGPRLVLRGVSKSKALHAFERQHVEPLVRLPLRRVAVERNETIVVGELRMLSRDWRADDHTLRRAVGVFCCHPEWIRELVGRGADPRQRQRAAGQNLLHALARQAPYAERQAQAARVLVRSGADVRAPDARGKSPLHLAVDVTLRDASKPGTLRESHREFLDGLLELGADPNTRDGRGETPLHAAIPFFPGIAQQLLAHGADPALENGRGESAIEHALYYLTEQRSVLSDTQEQALDNLVQEMRDVASTWSARAEQRRARERELARHENQLRLLEAHPQAKQAYLEARERSEAHARLMESQRKKIEALRKARAERRPAETGPQTK